ncbi:hypothetical protein FRC09_000879 [Ceratobasidium sp. 395]|nr:hypothetical protein FRC09_000879 [Ceratobasidium sp. 395]
MLETTSTWSEDGELIKTFNGKQVLFEAILEDYRGELTQDGIGNFIKWTYVIDLDSQAFTINGLMHFRLDNLPPAPLSSYFWRIPSPCCPGQTCIPTFAHLPSTPAEYIATVSRWPPPDFDVSQTHKDYKRLAPVILPIEEWGAPSWTSLTTAQRLSENLVQVILRDHAEQLSNPDVVAMRPSFYVCLWQLISAAAPSHLCCPLDLSPPSDSAKHTLRLSIKDLEESSKYFSGMTPHYHRLDDKYDNVNHKHYWFRGCLVVFCPRLDLVEYVECETILVVQRLRNYGRTTGIGMIFSGRHILAVAVNGDAVLCSCPLLFHDVKMNSQDGFLLATHLLSSHMTTDKTPWTEDTFSKCLVTSGACRLPDELIREIAFDLDYDSYQNLPQVSRLFRGIHTRYPRLGNSVLLDYVGNGNYRVLRTSTKTVRTLHLQRIAPFNNCHSNLGDSFQHVNLGPQHLHYNPSKYNWYGRGIEADYAVMLRDDARCDDGCWAKIHLQAVHGIWSFVVPAEAKSNFPKSLEYDRERDMYEGGGSWDEYRW